MAGLRQLLNAGDYLQEYDLLGFCAEDTAPESAKAGSGSERPRKTTPDHDLASLATTIETEIVPRLMLAHKVEFTECAPRRRTAAVLTPENVVTLASIVINEDLPQAQNFIDGLREEGVPLESVYLDLMAPAARHLGELWLEDRCTFMAVTIGLSRLQQLLRALSVRNGNSPADGDTGKRAFLVTYPGEQHSFGVYMVAEFFSRSGWDVWGGVPEDEAAVMNFVKDGWFDVLGLSVSLSSNRRHLPRLVRRMRKSSRNPRPAVLLGGKAFAGQENNPAEFGADAIAEDGREAVSRAEELLGSPQMRPS